MQLIYLFLLWFVVLLMAHIDKNILWSIMMLIFLVVKRGNPASQQLKNVILELQLIYQGYVATAVAKVMKFLLEISYKEHCL